jgi:hypothetical protein
MKKYNVLKKQLHILEQQKAKYDEKFINDKQLNANIKSLKSHLNSFDFLEVGDTLNYNIILPTGKKLNKSEMVISKNDQFVTLKKDGIKWRCTKIFYQTRLFETLIIK